ncbi:MAG: hypothetical protein EP330_03885 [Deltaproteobacteria bacterium]|nr:MAG: hypothetical protein EP330_03885 [Deltaproteobacteria bacterium]
MRTAMLATMLACSTPAMARPPLAESQRQDWVDWLIQDGDRRFQQGQVLAAIGAGVVFLGAGLSLGPTLENGRSSDALRPGTVLAFTGGPLLLAGLPTMAAGAGRMRRALRMEGIFVPNTPLVGAWSMLGAGLVLLPIASQVWDIPPAALLLAAGTTGISCYGLATAQHKLNRAVDFPRPWVFPVPIRQGAALGITARW